MKLLCTFLYGWCGCVCYNVFRFELKSQTTLLVPASLEFFKDVGEVYEVRLAKNAEGEFRGFGHVEFTSEEAAQKVFFCQCLLNF